VPCFSGSCKAMRSKSNSNTSTRRFTNRWW
jgi:hypothetical protein